MSPDKARAFLQLLNRQSSYDGTRLVRSSCPLAPWKHQHGKDSNPSFGISTKQGEPSFFNCYACQAGSLQVLVQTMEFCSQQDGSYQQYQFAKARALLDDDTGEVIALPEFTEFFTASNVFEAWPEHFISNYSSVQWSKPAMSYLATRSVTVEQAVRFDLRYDPYREMIMSPYRNVYGSLAGARGRSIVDSDYKHHDYTYNQINNGGMVWYNEQVLANEKPVVLVEGQFDLYTVEKVYPEVLANLTAKPQKAKMARLAQCEGIVLLMDNDLTGKKALGMFLSQLDQMGIPVNVAVLPEEFKDANQAGVEVVAETLKKLGLEL